MYSRINHKNCKLFLGRDIWFCPTHKTDTSQNQKSHFCHRTKDDFDRNKTDLIQYFVYICFDFHNEKYFCYNIAFFILDTNLWYQCNCTLLWW